MPSPHPVIGAIIHDSKRIVVRRLEGLADYQRAVEGNIEPVDLSLPGHRYVATMYVNEEFRYAFGEGARRVNYLAMDLCLALGATHLGMTGIKGPVVVVGIVDQAGRDTDLEQRVLDIIKRVAGEAGATITTEL